jgi:hypothetical protein
MQETWWQAFIRRPHEFILLFTIGLPLLPFYLIYRYISDLFDSASTKKEFNKLSETLTSMEDELRSSSESKKAYLRRCMKVSYKANDRSFFKEAMVKQTERDLEELGCDIGVRYRNDPYVNPNIFDDSVERIFLDAESEINVMFKRISLLENIPQTHNSQYGEFFNAYQDLLDVYDTDYSKFSDLVKKAYGHARIELAAVLLLQGIFSDVDFNNEQEIFPDVDIENDDFDFWYLDDIDARDLAEDYLERYDIFRSYVLPFVYDGRITSRMVGPTHRSSEEVLKLISRLEDLDRAEDDFSPDNYCGSKNIYECLLGSNEDKQFSEEPQDDDEIPF